MNYSDDFTHALSRRADAIAFVSGSAKYPGPHGSIRFYQLPDGVIVRTHVFGLPSGNKPCGDYIFAFHIHGGRSCSGNDSDPFADAENHYNPHGCPHPYHAGDLPPLFGADGQAFSVFLTNRFTVREIIGKSVIIHSQPDDFTTQPSGNAGKKIACGVIGEVVK